MLALMLLAAPAQAKTQEYSLRIAQETVTITGKPLKRITINGTIPGPVLEFTQGSESVIHVTNAMDEGTSVHWHGLLLPGAMDGVPGLNGFAGIRPGQTFTYRFPLRQAGTYWYHAHSLGQEQDGHYGAIVIHPWGAEAEPAERDYVVLLSDFHEHSAARIMANLKKSPEYYARARRTLSDLLGGGFAEASAWGQMRMMRTDLSDVSGYTFLVNGKTPEQNWTGLFAPGERVRLRFINASAMTFYDVRIPGLTMTVVAADGQSVEPVEVDEFRFGAAETYDVIVRPEEDRAYTIAAEALDRSGFALATLAPQMGMRGPAPTPRPRVQLTMADMGMDHGDMDHAAMGHDMAPMRDYATGVPGSGWAQAGTPPGHKALAYTDLRHRGVQPDQDPPEREITVRLGGNMERYVWTLNGQKHADSGPITLGYGERVRLTFVNDTMMAHPMHLHGMFMQLENGQAPDKLPNKHTVIIAPGDSYSVLLTANEAGQWAFHCHLLYHMMGGMMTTVVVSRPSDGPPPAPEQATHAGGHGHDMH